MALVSSLLAECGGKSTDKIRVAVRVFSGSSLNINPSETTHLIDAVFGLLSSGITSDRISFWNTLPVITQSRYYTSAIPQISAMIPKLHQYIQTAKNTEERNAICKGILCILELEQSVESIYTKLDNILSKLIGVVLKFVRSDTDVSDCFFGLQLLHTFCSHRGRVINMSHGSAISGACLNILLLQCGACGGDKVVTWEVRSLAASVLALHSSFGSADHFESLWLNLTLEYSNVLTELGLWNRPLTNSGLKDGKNMSNSTNKQNIKSSTRRGVARAIELECVFQGITQALLELYWHGCAAGAVALDYSSHLISVIGTAVCHRVEMRPDDPKFGIPNASSIAPMHMGLVSSQFKVHALTLLETLIRQPQHCLPTASLLGVCCTCLSTIFSNYSDFHRNMISNYNKASDSIIKLGLSCFRSAVRCYPAMITQRCLGAVKCIVDLLGSAMTTATVAESIPDATSLVGKQCAGSVSSAHADSSTIDICDVMHTIEVMLLTAAPLIDIELRRSIEYLVGIGLRSVVKGVMQSDSYQKSHTSTNDTLLSLASGKGSSSSSKPQKRMKRASCESIRTNMDAINVLLRLALAEVSAPYSDGSRSGNMSLMKNAVSVCVGVDVLTIEASRVSRYIEAVLFPLSCNIPGIPVGPVAIDFYPVDSNAVAHADSCISSHIQALADAPMAKKAQAASTASSGAKEVSADDEMEEAASAAATSSCEVNRSVPSVALDPSIVPTSVKSTKKVSGPISTQISVTVEKSSPAQSLKKRLYSASLGKEEDKSTSGGKDSDSDDDDLPDLDIEADPDQN